MWVCAWLDVLTFVSGATFLFMFNKITCHFFLPVGLTPALIKTDGFGANRFLLFGHS